ncbi:MAG: lactonase family protein [Ferruginibacter sp.]
MPIKTLFSLLLFFNAAFAQTNSYLLIGTYTSGKSEGIYVYDFNSANADNKQISTVMVSNPSYLAVSPNKKIVYSVSENADAVKTGVGGSVSALAFNKDNGSLTLINEQFSEGKHPCYVAVDKTGKWVFVANYSSGSAAMYAVKEDGGIEPAKKVIQFEGTGFNKQRQEGPHAHSTVISPDNKYLFVQDLGLDKIMTYRFDDKMGTLTAASKPFVKSVDGSGPRHLDFHPNKRNAYLIEEMTGTVVAFKYANGNLQQIQRISALQKDFKGDIGSADIHVSRDGKFLYCSNRGGSNDITIFKISSNGKLTVAGRQSTMGKTPRNFNFDPTGNYLLAANQQSDEVVIFKVNRTTGLLKDTGKRISVPNPVCIKWISK